MFVRGRTTGAVTERGGTGHGADWALFRRYGYSVVEALWGLGERGGLRRQRISHVSDPRIGSAQMAVNHPAVWATPVLVEITLRLAPIAVASQIGSKNGAASQNAIQISKSDPHTSSRAHSLSPASATTSTSILRRIRRGLLHDEVTLAVRPLLLPRLEWRHSCKEEHVYTCVLLYVRAYSSASQMVPLGVAPGESRRRPLSNIVGWMGVPSRGIVIRCPPCWVLSCVASRCRAIGLVPLVAFWGAARWRSAWELKQSGEAARLGVYTAIRANGYTCERMAARTKRSD